MSRRASRAALLLVAASLLAAGCGGDPVASFREHGLRPLEMRVDASRAQLSALLRGVQPGSTAAAQALRVEAAPLAQTARLLSQLSAPAAIDRPRRAYAAAAGRLAAELRRLANALASRSTPALRLESARVRDAVGALQQARITLDEAAAR